MDIVLRKERTRQVTLVKTEQTLAFLKPESIMRGLIGEIISRFERKGLLLVAAKLLQMSDKQARELYAMHSSKPFFQELVSHVTSAPVFVMAWEGPNAVSVARNLVGATNPAVAAPGTIRGDFALNITPNAIHASDSLENAKRELSIFFSEAEKTSYSKPTEQQYLLK
ncbi:MAG TPA: nucleoside-diphosphate kinase [Candidatus Bathyarchaeia archaeon]|nr:nucleoside-diphosphate kinase [Candidatus Bathyarchaeia archaeon]